MRILVIFSLAVFVFIGCRIGTGGNSGGTVDVLELSEIGAGSYLMGEPAGNTKLKTIVEPTPEPTPDPTPDPTPTPTGSPTPTPTPSGTPTPERTPTPIQTSTPIPTPTPTPEPPAEADNPEHTVELDTFSIGCYEVTNGIYVQVLNWALTQDYLTEEDGVNLQFNGKTLLFLNDAACRIGYSNGAFEVNNTDDTSFDRHPVTSVSWYGALAFCNWLSEMRGLNPCYDLESWMLISPATDGYRLPTEAEWERAAGWDGSVHWTYGFDNEISAGLCNYNYSNPLFLAEGPYTTPVSYYSAHSPAGCFDMSGNVAEWCQDWYGSDYYFQPENDVNPGGPATGTEKVLRGGSWSDDGQSCETAGRSSFSPDLGSGAIGFRLAR